MKVILPPLGDEGCTSHPHTFDPNPRNLAWQFIPCSDIEFAIGNSLGSRPLAGPPVCLRLIGQSAKIGFSKTFSEQKGLVAQSKIGSA
jgi:hypothetical protein